MQAVKLTGNFAEVLKFRKKIEDLTEPALRTTVNRNLQEEALNLIAEGFASATDPYGKPWNAPNNLQITGGIRRYAPTGLSPEGWSVAATDQKAIWHHNPQPRKLWGGKKLPTRLQVPSPPEDLPPNWYARFVEAAEDVLDAHFKP